MTIQLITNRSIANIKEIKISEFESPKSLDEFDLNIIDLSSGNIWRNIGHDTKQINQIYDFLSIQKMIKNSNRATIVYVLPKNVFFYFSYYDSSYGASKYTKAIKLKDIIPEAINIISNIIPHKSNIHFEFEPTTTKVNDLDYEADFCFRKNHDDIITKSFKSEKSTTIRHNEYFFTTLQIIQSSEHLKNFIDTIVSPATKEEVPEWVKEYRFYDDEEKYNLIEQSNEIVEKEKNKIEENNKKLNENLKYKSILYSNGNELVEVVFEILEKILSKDLSQFADKNDEDFLIEFDEYDFIGEIKGVSSNVKSEHISQLGVHCSKHQDKLQNEEIEKDIKQLLIINTFRNKPIDKRDDIHQNQIKLAIRNSCLIIETKTLLKIFEDFLSRKISCDGCIELFYNNKGLLKYPQ